MSSVTNWRQWLINYKLAQSFNLLCWLNLVLKD